MFEPEKNGENSIRKQWNSVILFFFIIIVNIDNDIGNCVQAGQVHFRYNCFIVSTNQHNFKGKIKSARLTLFLWKDFYLLSENRLQSLTPTQYLFSWSAD